jgi:chromosome segregation ATPase
MKLHLLFLILLVALIGSSIGQEEVEVTAEGMVEEAASKPCDCASEVAEAVGAVANERNGLLAQLEASRQQANSRGADIDALTGQLNAVKVQLAASELAVKDALTKAETAAADASKSTESAASKIQMLEAEVAAAKAEAEVAKKEADEFKTTWAVLNIKRIQMDIVNMLKKFGILKD